MWLLIWIVGICNIPKIFEKILRCSDKMRQYTLEDRGNYTVAWKSLTQNYVKQSPWTYSESNSDAQFFGKFSLAYNLLKIVLLLWSNLILNYIIKKKYFFFLDHPGKISHSNGYILDLTQSGEKNVLNLFKFLASHWLDYLTWFVVIEFTLFNVNTNLISSITVASENMPTNNFEVQIQVCILCTCFRIRLQCRLHF